MEGGGQLDVYENTNAITSHAQLQTKQRLRLGVKMSEPSEKKPRKEGDHGLPNSYLDDIPDDYMYHFAYSKSDCKKMFGDVKVRSYIAIAS